MEAICIKRSTNTNRSILWLLITSIPVALFFYAAYDANKSSDKLMFIVIACVFLLPAIIDFLANKIIPLKTAVMVSEKGIALSASKGIYDSFAFLNFYRTRQIRWQSITSVNLSVEYSSITSYPNEGESSVTANYSKVHHQLVIRDNTQIEPVVFSLDNLDVRPDKILELCKQFLINKPV
jgi:hypothetical protein